VQVAVDAAELVIGFEHPAAYQRTAMVPPQTSPASLESRRAGLARAGRARRKPLSRGAPTDLGRPRLHPPRSRAHPPRAARYRTAPGAPHPPRTAPQADRPRADGWTLTHTHARTREHAHHLPGRPREILFDRLRPVSVWESARTSNTAIPSGKRLTDPFRSQQEYGMEYGFAGRPEPASVCRDLVKVAILLDIWPMLGQRVVYLATRSPVVRLAAVGRSAGQEVSENAARTDSSVRMIARSRPMA
jgi:hypothetical protein